jgi:hypothetical protein
MNGFQKLAIKRKYFFINFLFSVSLGLLIYIRFFQRHFFSWTYLAYAVLIAAAGFFLVGWLNRRFFRSFFTDTPKLIRNFVLLFSVVMSLLLLLNTEIQPLYYVLPDSNLEIRFTIPELDEGEENVRLLWIKTGQGYVHYTRMAINGAWERVQSNIIFEPGQEVTITWQGKAGPKAEIAFRQTDFDQPVEVTWNGVSKTYDLNSPREPNIYIQNRFDVPVIDLLPFTLAFLVAVCFGIFTALVLLAAWDPGKRRIPSKNRWGWLLYMLPMLLVWGFTLAVFWPGIMSSDSLSQWAMGVTGQYNDWQSGFHAILLAALMRVWYSPAFIAILQIICFALVATWGLKTLGENGVPRIVLWVISLLFAWLPANGIFSITLWKDIPYAIAFLWLTVMIIRIVLARGDAGHRGVHWVWLGIAAFLVAILRHNGAAVAAVTLIVLLVVYRRSWKHYLGAILVAALLYLGVTGPLYSSVNLDRASSGQSNLIYLHHISAHLAAGTPLKPEESAYLDGLLPLEDWTYWCYYVGELSYDTQFERAYFLSNTPQNRAVALSLFARDPLVDVRHALCAGELAWKFENNINYMKSTHGISRWRVGEVITIGDNSFGLSGNSKLPGLVDGYIRYLRTFGFFDDILVFWLRPAFWLYIAAFCAAAVVARRGDTHFLLAVLPVFCQAGVLLLVSFAPAFRYHYGTVLAGLFMLGLIFVPERTEDK